MLGTMHRAGAIVVAVVLSVGLLPQTASGGVAGQGRRSAAVDAVRATPTPFAIDPVHSSVEFRVRHMGISTVTGRFGTFSGTFVFDPDSVAASSVSATIDATSIDTGNERRDRDLRSDEFFDVDRFPRITFESSRVEPLGGDSLRISGELTMHGVTRPVVLAAALGGLTATQRGPLVAFTASTRVHRQDFGLNFNRLAEGVALVGDDVDITIAVEARGSGASE